MLHVEPLVVPETDALAEAVSGPMPATASSRRLGSHSMSDTGVARPFPAIVDGPRLGGGSLLTFRRMSTSVYLGWCRFLK